MQTDKYFK